MNSLKNFSETNTSLFTKASNLFGFNNISNSERESISSPATSQLDQRGYDQLLTSKTLYQMAAGQLPDLWKVCMELHSTFSSNHAPYSAMQFVPVLNQINLLDKKQLNSFLANEETNHVLIQNEWLKAVLIHWKPGKQSNIHGHPEGGCVFKVLHGKLEEKRYDSTTESKLLGISTLQQGGMAYIDDTMAHHAVGNPFESPAISLHVYTPGIRKLTKS